MTLLEDASSPFNLAMKFVIYVISLTIYFKFKLTRKLTEVNFVYLLF